MDDKQIWSIFKEKPCNFILSMTIDGVNPFGDLRSIYSLWPFFMINNNLPSLMSIKREHVMFSLVVPYIYFYYVDFLEKKLG